MGVVVLVISGSNSSSTGGGSSEARSSIVGWSTMPQEGKVAVSILEKVTGFVRSTSQYSPGVDSDSNRSRNLPGGVVRPASNPDNLTAICELIV
jgi:hypothetical protein